MRKNYNALKNKMAPERRDRAEARMKEMIAEMLLTELRGQAGLTQDEVARKLGIKQPSLSKLESQKDMQISTLMRLVEALGGSLEIIAHMPKGDIRVSQFHGPAQPS
jgi:DNA-binding XRE family transcriptional regulator